VRCVWRKGLLRKESDETLVPDVGLEPTTYRLPYHFGFRRLAFVVWTIPSPWRIRFRRPPSSLYTFPQCGLGSGLAWPHRALAFPEFEGFCTCRFPQGTRIFKAVALPAELTRHSFRSSISLRFIRPVRGARSRHAPRVATVLAARAVCLIPASAWKAGAVETTVSPRTRRPRSSATSRPASAGPPRRRGTSVEPNARTSA
jgi:hypothetical protein